MRTKNLRRKTGRGGTATLTGPQPARVKDRIDVDQTFGDLVMRRAKAAKVDLTEEQKEQAILFAIHLFHARATSDPMAPQPIRTSRITPRPMPAPGHGRAPGRRCCPTRRCGPLTATARSGVAASITKVPSGRPSSDMA